MSDYGYDGSNCQDLRKMSFDHDDDVQSKFAIFLTMKMIIGNWLNVCNETDKPLSEWCSQITISVRISLQ